MARADLSTSPRMRLGIVIVVLLLHVAAILGLIRAFAPDMTNAVVKTVVAAFTVTVETKNQPDPGPAKAAREEEGAAAPAGKKAKPKETAAPKPKVAIAKKNAPSVASTGDQDTSGARNAGEGTGGGGEGAGTGSGNSGNGQGGGSPLVKIAGDIRTIEDYPRPNGGYRVLRGHNVRIQLRVGVDGVPRTCAVIRPSPFPEIDKITCNLAVERFRFKPRTDGNGNPVEGVYAWTQRWFAKG